MKILLIDNAGHEMLGIDGTMIHDKRNSVATVKAKIKQRNETLVKNFPHKVATAFMFWDNESPNRYNERSKGKIYTL